MMHRKKVGKRYSKKLFRKGSRVKARNLRASPMRGGFRI